MVLRRCSPVACFSCGFALLPVVGLPLPLGGATMPCAHARLVAEMTENNRGDDRARSYASRSELLERRYAKERQLAF